MPIKNEFFGVFKTLQVSSKYVIAQSANRSRVMDVKAKNYIQGTAKNRIMDIGGMKEDISITAPILIGGGSAIDGRSLLTDQIDNALQRTGATLPILASAEVRISTEEGGVVSLSLKSDGNPTNSGVFEIRDEDAAELTDGTTADLLDPTSGVGPTRLAKFYDFRVSLAGYYLYVKEARIKVNVETTENYFLGGAAGGSLSTDKGIPGAGGSTAANWPGNDTSNPNNFGTQFAWLGVSGITIEGGGSAAALLADTDADGDVTDGGDTHTNVTFSTTATELTEQLPGAAYAESSTFKFEVYDGTAWVGLFRKVGDTVDLFDLSKSILKKADFKVTNGLLTVDFEFACWVK